MEEKRNWLHALFNHPKRDYIIMAYISSYRGVDQNLWLEDITLTSDQSNRNILAVKCCSFSTLDGDVKEPVSEMLYIGEYFRFTESNPEPTYLFNEINAMFGGRNTHHIIKILQELNKGVVIDGKSYMEFVKESSQKQLDKMYEKNSEEYKLKEKRLNDVISDKRDILKANPLYKFAFNPPIL